MSFKKIIDFIRKQFLIIIFLIIKFTSMGISFFLHFFFIFIGIFFILFGIYMDICIGVRSFLIKLSGKNFDPKDFIWALVFSLRYISPFIELLFVIENNKCSSLFIKIFKFFNELYFFFINYFRSILKDSIFIYLLLRLKNYCFKIKIIILKWIKKWK